MCCMCLSFCSNSKTLNADREKQVLGLTSTTAPYEQALHDVSTIISNLALLNLQRLSH